MTKNKRWTKEESKFLKDNFDKLTSEEITLKLGRSKYSVSNAYRRFKIKKEKGVILKEKYRKGIFVGPNKGKKLLYLTKRNLENNPMKNQQTREKANKSIREGFKNGRKTWNKDLSGKEYLKHYGGGETWLIKQQKDKRIQRKFIEKALKTKKERGSMPKGKNHHWYGKTKEDCFELKKISDRMKKNNPNKNGKLWKDSEYIKKVKKAMNLKPNKSEQIIINLIKENNFPFKYVGDFSYWIDGFCPDFISTNKDKKIIEFNGTYWHEMEDHIERDKRKMKTYKRLGYKTLVIWSSELKNEEQILNKIKNF